MKLQPNQSSKSEILLALHHGDSPLLLPNVWNPVGARLLAAKGYPAIATASAAISASLGYEDGEKIQRSTLLDVLARIAGGVGLPVSADIEAGYASTLSELEETIEGLIDTGVVGINIEDSLDDGGTLRSSEDQCARLSMVRETAERRGLHLVINARVDSFLASSYSDIAEATEDAVERARAYAVAGADCIYPIGVGDEATLRLLRARITSPLNALAIPGASSLSTLASIGMNRVSFGPFVFRACLKKFSDIADAVLAGSDDMGLEEMYSKDEMSEFLREGPE